MKKYEKHEKTLKIGFWCCFGLAGPNDIGGAP